MRKKKNADGIKWNPLPTNDAWITQLTPTIQLHLVPNQYGCSCKLIRQDSDGLYSVLWAFQIHDPSASLKTKQKMAERKAREFLQLSYS